METSIMVQDVTGGNSLRSQIATLNKGRGSNIKYQPFAFTELEKPRTLIGFKQKKETK